MKLALPAATPCRIGERNNQLAQSPADATRTTPKYIGGSATRLANSVKAAAQATLGYMWDMHNINTSGSWTVELINTIYDRKPDGYMNEDVD